MGKSPSFFLPFFVPSVCACTSRKIGSVLNFCKEHQPFLHALFKATKCSSYKKIKSCHAKFWFLAAYSKLVPDYGWVSKSVKFFSTSHQFVVKVPDSRVLGSRFTFIVSPTDHAIPIHAFHHRARVMQIDKC